MIKFLVKSGADVHATTVSGLTALHIAAQNGESDIIANID